MCNKTIISLVAIAGLLLCIGQPVLAQDGRDSLGRKTLYQSVYESEGMPTLEIETNTKSLIRRSELEEYQPATISLAFGDEKITNLPTEIRARGNVRKRVCEIPPMKINFKKWQLDSLGFSRSADKLKLLIPCTYLDEQQQFLFKEHFLYGAFSLVDTNALRSKVIKVVITSKGKEKFNVYGLLLEDEDAYAQRNDAIVIEPKNLTQGGIDRKSFLRMMFFQYMIGNTDWGIPTIHNIEIVKLPNVTRVVALPYDYDYSGFVNQPYAVPNVDLPIKTVRERYFFSYKISDEEYDEMIALFQRIENPIRQFLKIDKFLSDDSKEDCKIYLDSFFKAIKNPEELKPKIQRRT